MRLIEKLISHIREDCTPDQVDKFVDMIETVGYLMLQGASEHQTVATMQIQFKFKTLTVNVRYD